VIVSGTYFKMYQKIRWNDGEMADEQLCDNKVLLRVVGSGDGKWVFAP